MTTFFVYIWNDQPISLQTLIPSLHFNLMFLRCTHSGERSWHLSIYFYLFFLTLPLRYRGRIQNGATTFSMTTLSIATPSIMRLSIKGLFVTHSIKDFQHRWRCIECHYAEFCNLFIVMLNAIMLNVIMLNVIMPNVIILNVIMLNVIMLNVIMPNVIIPNVIILNVIMLNVIMLSLCSGRYAEWRGAFKALLFCDLQIGPIS
jgi:hypothetical protein